MNLEEMGIRAKKAQQSLKIMPESLKNTILKGAADALIENSSYILEENKKDMEKGKEKGLSSGLLDRLKLDEDRLSQIRMGMYQVADLKDPVGEVIDSEIRPNGLEILKKRVPIGVIGMIYEARPNVTADAFALCFKSGNTVILRGGSAASASNAAIVETIRQSISSNCCNPDYIQLITDNDRKTVEDFMHMDRYLDLMIPRGGASLIRSVVQNCTVPVIQTGEGNCHIYVDESGDVKKAVDIILNAKTQRVGVCNACESLLIHKNIYKELSKELFEKLSFSNVEIRGSKDICKDFSFIKEAAESDWGCEYLDYVLSVKTVDSIDEAIEHINKYSTGHSESIITENYSNARKFLNEIDSACVYVNASTRFSDGFEFGLGAEIGISTQKLHARGPMGLKELTSYKYVIYGNGQIRC